MAKDVLSDHIFLSELQLWPEYQGRGIGSRIITLLQEEALRLDKPIRLRVLRENRARQLYERLEFISYGATDTHILMEWTGEVRS